MENREFLMYKKGWVVICKEDRRYLECLYKNYTKVIHLWKQDGKYMAQVLPMAEERTLSIEALIIHEEIEVVKFKALVKARELGWNVNIMNFNKEEI